MEDQRFEEQVAIAANWLDKHYPGWATKIDREDFDMADAYSCIGAYLGVDWDYDLNVPFRTETGIAGMFSSHTDEWQEEIGKRV